MTPEELEDFTHEPSSETIPTLTPTLREWLFDPEKPSPQAAYRRAFERRKPAMGADQDLLLEIKTHYNSLPPGVQQRSLYSSVRSEMLRQLISCNGASTMDDLLEILQKELDTGVPAPVPDWYKFSTVTMGPRKVGYDSCCNRGCARTETHDEPQFQRCSKCKVALYCSRECQLNDWKARHGKFCKEAAKKMEEGKQVGKMMQNLSDLSLTGASVDDSMAGAFGNLNARENPAVRQRRRELRAEKKRPNNHPPPDGPDPNLF